MINKLRYVGWVVESLEKATDDINKIFGLTGIKVEEGQETATRILLPNECWLYLREAEKTDELGRAFFQQHGENLDHLGFETDNIEEELERLQKAGMKYTKNDIADTPEGLVITVPAEDATGFTVKLIQPKPQSFQFDKAQCSNPNVLGLQHIGVAVKDMEYTIKRFKELFGLAAEDLREDQHYGTQKDMMINTGNDRLWLHLVQTDDPENRVFQFRRVHGENLEHLAIEVDDIRKAVKQVQAADVPLFLHKIYLDREDGFESFVYPEYNHGVTVELIEPYEDSRGYRPRPRV